MLCLSMALVFSVCSAWANTAANTQIINNATLSYNNGVSTQVVTASVTVVVSLVPAAPAITKGADQTTPYNGPATLLKNSFTVTATSNGPDTYNVTSAITGSSNTSGPTTTPETPTITLGATVTTTGSSQTVLNVPSDGVSGSKVNGIQATNTVVINGVAYTVSSVNNTGSGVATITISPGLPSAPAAGVLVAQQAVVLVDVTAGTLSAPGTNVVVSKSMTLTSTTNSGVTATSGSVNDTYPSGTATLAKYVRNTTTPSGTGTPYVYNSASYYQTGVIGKPGDILEYILVSTNSGTGPVTAATVTDALPITYVTFNSGAYGSAKDFTYVSDTGTVSYYTAAADTDPATYVATSGALTVYIGNGATSSAGGSIPGGAKELVLYQVKIN